MYGVVNSLNLVVQIYGLPVEGQRGVRVSVHVLARMNMCACMYTEYMHMCVVLVKMRGCMRMNIPCVYI